MKVAHVKSRYGPVGGIESMLAGLMPALAAEPGLEPLLVFVTHEDDPAMLDRLTGAGVVPAHVLRWGGLKAAPLTAWRLARLLRAEGVDVVHTHDMRANLLAALAGPLGRPPWIAHVHGWLGPTHSGPYRRYEAVDRRLIRRADHVLTGSHATLAEVRAAGARAASVQWNAVPVPAMADPATARSALGLPRDATIFTILGRLHPGKGQDLFLSALAALPAAADWHGVVVGVGEAEAALKAQAAALGLGARVTFTGFVASTDPWVAASDVIVVPSRKESLPLTCLEGMARARAVVVSDAGDLARVVQDGVTGLVVPVDDGPALASAMRRVLDDPALRAALGSAARRHVMANHTVGVLARGMTDVARGLISR